MLETVFDKRTMEFIPQPAEPAVRLHLLVVDPDPAVRSACAEIAASLGYVVESTGDLGQARSLLRGRAADILLVNLPWGSNTDMELITEVKLLYPADVGDRDDRLGIGECGGRGHALRRLGLSDQALRHGRALDGAGPRSRRQPYHRYRHTAAAREASPVEQGWAR